METYNRIMQFFWLAMAVVIGVSVTYMSITESFEKWGFNYVFVFLVRRYMMKRMKKHQEYLNNQHNKK